MIKGKRLLFVGYATADIRGKQWTLGGAAGVMALNAAHLGFCPSLLAVLADDAYGKKYKKALERAGVNYSLCPSVPHLPTCVINDIHGLGSTRQWEDHGANQYLADIVVSADFICSFDAVFLVNSHPILAEKVAQYKSSSLFYIPGPQIVKQKHYLSEKVITASRVIFGNEEEMPLILDSHPFIRGVKMIVATAGKKGGVVLFPNGKQLAFTAPEVKALDTTGAGDAFALGFGLALVRRQTVQQAIAAGKVLASRVLSRPSGLIFIYQ